MTLLLGIVGLLVLGMASVSLATVEAAFYQFKRRRLGHVAVSNPRAELTNEYLEDPPRLLVPVHTGTYIAHVSMTGIMTLVLMGWIGRWAVGVAFVVMIAYLLSFRLAVPYAIARRTPERVLIFLVPLLDRYLKLMTPVVALLRRSGAHGDVAASEVAEPGVTVVAYQGTTPSSNGQSAERQLQDAVERFTTLIVRNIMTPRPDVVAIPETMTVQRARRIAAETKLSRLPVYRDNLDDVAGVITVRDLIECTGDGQEPVAALVRSMHVVPESKKVLDLLRELQALHATIALVVDEYGGVAGVVSMEDIVEELVGDIKDEYDFEGEPIVTAADGAYLVSGRVALTRVEQALGTSLCDEGDVETAGGLVAKAFGRIPSTGETMEYKGYTIEVIDAVPRRVNRVRLRRSAGTGDR